MKKLIVLGAGESGRGVALLARRRGWQVLVSDGGSVKPGAIEELRAANVQLEQNGHSNNLFQDADCVVKSPGIPWNAAVVERASQQGLVVIGEMEFCAPYRGNTRLVGITGSNGKTTTTLLLTHLLQEAGIDAYAGGNVGTSYARLLLEQPDAKWFVLELSSFQLEDIRDFRVDIGMLLNLSPDHLDRYADGFAGYAAAKYRLLQTMRAGDLWLQPATEFASLPRPAAASGVQIVEMPAAFTGGRALTPRHHYDLRGTVLGGPHNAANASFALTAAEAIGVAKQKLERGLQTFKNAPHRLEYVGSVGRCRFINDSKATNLDASRQALASFSEPIVWIVGGVDKGNDYAQLYDLVQEHVAGVVVMGQDNRKIEAAFSTFENLPVRSTNSLTAALQQAVELAPPNAVILLSPACASFDLFDNYIDRGNQFKDAVRQLPGFTT